MTDTANPNGPVLEYVRAMEFGVLGPLEVVEGDHRYPLGGPKQQRVLALLISQAGRPVSVSSLIESIYADEATERVHRSIHTFVSNLRSELGNIIERRGEGYVFLADRPAVDAYRFEDESMRQQAMRTLPPPPSDSKRPWPYGGVTHTPTSRREGL